MTAAAPLAALEPPATGSADPGERLTFTLFLALALHALLILGVGFSFQPSGERQPTLEITLANHKSQATPEQADFLAQHSQEASGTIDEARAQTSDQQAEFFAPSIQEANPRPQQRQIAPGESRQQQLVTTTGRSRQQALRLTEAPAEAAEARDGEALERPQVNPEIASLMAKMDRQRQQYAKRPRIRHLTSVATRGSPEAAYLLKWTDKVEFVGNRDFPLEALRREIFGALIVAVRILPDGRLDRVDITTPSGYPLLDESAKRIIRDASPFAPVPRDVLQDNTHLEIVRTLRFEITGLRSH